VETQFHKYVENVTMTTCEKELNKLISEGPPIYLSDANGFPCEPDDFVVALRFGSTTEVPAKLKGALEGEERQKLWDYHKTFVVKRDGVASKEEE
jgi:hypothetical protein